MEMNFAAEPVCRKCAENGEENPNRTRNQILNDRNRVENLIPEGAHDAISSFFPLPLVPVSVCMRLPTANDGSCEIATT